MKRLGAIPALGLGVLAIVMLNVGLVRAEATPAAKCAALKQKAAGKAATAKLTCYSKAVAHGSPVDGSCLGKADEKFAVAFAKADGPGCAITGDAASVKSAVDAFVAGSAASESATPCTTVEAPCGTTCGGAGI